MITVKLMGGLGNQLFQYAAARRLSHFSNARLQLDLSWFSLCSNADTARAYALHPFHILEDCPAPAVLSQFPAPFPKLTALARRFSPFRGHYLKEKHFHFDPELLLPRKEAYLDGYWQSERYFQDIREILLKEFTVKTAPAGLNRSLADQIQSDSVASVALHIRRGDYVNNLLVHNFHGTCSLEYYQAAISKMVSLLPKAHFFLFSDDPGWVTSSFVVDHPFTLVSHNGPEAAHEDLRLMSLCRHHIIANSTFSWWGAWLSQGVDKTVVAPTRWFAADKPDARDVIPESWVRI